MHGQDQGGVSDGQRVRGTWKKGVAFPLPIARLAFFLSPPASLSAAAAALLAGSTAPLAAASSRSLRSIVKRMKSAKTVATADEHGAPLLL